ncbi:uncharacterized protein BDZ99DRAFT_434624 [Mytilinidion resinicola]|uniref:Programmed cell death protein 2 C-terminal domain-containing protein n=1 Tax=Mytilinidion resinicola TaxID=574789 RepID=A0A6A6Z296_9PEZI|nr:uncharacterized protein BDZ99DRAFT_434624 [Mytilinidion resinicola]KAF2814793.1 hypothetical protein BDZ99DRAFT_434624 [Mytilinidion resinicola]
MAAYDSDSSGGEDNFTETNVLLGYASQEPTGDAVSHLGGVPAWLDDTTAPSGALAKCKVCNSLLSLLLELNGDLPEHFPGHERRLYVFSCRRKACRRKEGSVRGIRGTRVTKVKDEKKTPAPEASTPQESGKKAVQSNIGESLFGVKSPGASSGPVNPFANPFASGTASKAPANPFATSKPTSTPEPASSPATSAVNAALTSLPVTFAEKARIAPLSKPTESILPRPHEPWPDQSAFPEPYPQYHLDADYETLDAFPTPTIPESARMDVDEPSASSGGDKELFESTLDKEFQRFADQLAQNPEQVLRYEFKGAPLLYNRSDAVGKLLAPTSHGQGGGKVVVKGGSASRMSRCKNCGSERVFELQLTPHAITELEGNSMSLDGMDWGTIILGVCAKDCVGSDVGEGEVGYVEEWVGVQWEEVSKK